ncbi:MAG: membrane-bound PQQ-dependent dehydrogenase, glucose/quinate/shikimate family [Gammaproteobacteria bacterium]|nr:membrane-bound PQQ-dependent dehydrogenase, glucose/quinate/shikimate family [Gammaproteobacteria bacterium]
MSNWQGKVCVVTGAGSGIGGGLARHAAGLGMQVIAADVDEAGLRQLEETIRSRGQSIETRRTDVRDEQAVEALASHAFAKHGKVHLLFNNAGVLVDGKSWERPMRDWRWSFEVNVYGAIHGIRAFVPRMLAQGEPGRIVNTSSQGGLMSGGMYLGPYQATKHAVTALTETLYAELALEDAPITVSCLCPGEVATDIWKSDRLRPEEERHRLASESERQYHDAVSGANARSQAPDELALQVFEAIEAGKFWIVSPGEGFKRSIELRTPLHRGRAAAALHRRDHAAVRAHVRAHEGRLTLVLRGLGLKALGGLLFAMGAWLALGGARLVSLGGSWYYLLSGLATLGSAVLLWRQRRLGLWVYLALLAATVVWALAEVGLDFWQLVPRLGLPLAVSIYLLLPWMRGAFVEAQGSGIGFRKLGRGARAASLLLVAGAIAVLAVGWREGRAVNSLAVVQPAAAASPTAATPRGTDWSAYGASESGTRYSAAAQITPENAHRLEVSWQYRTGDLPGAYPGKQPAYMFEATPVKVGETLYFCTPRDIVVALDADTGREKWRHGPKIDTSVVKVAVCRGVAYHEARTPVPDCPRRILVATVDARLMALDAETGARCQSFGANGEISLREGLGSITPGYYLVTSPPAIVGDAAVLGGHVLDGVSSDMPSGVVRAFDAVTGRQLWAWDAARPAELGPLKPGEIYPRGSPNAWTLFSADPELGLVYIPTGNATPDYYGAHRPESFDRFASSVIALEAATGRLRWSFQTVHHDLWDYDVGSQPVLVDLPIGGETVPALLQPTKQGEIYLLDRRDGRALAAVEEHAVPKGDVPGERYAPTQPFSVGMPSFASPPLTEADMWGATLLDQLACRIEFRRRRYEGLYTPPSVTPTIQYPGNFGVMNWGSVAVDEDRRIMIVNTSYMPMLNRLVPRAEAEAMQAAAAQAEGSGHGSSLSLMPQLGTPYASEFGPFLSPLGFPCKAPPWGKLAAVDLEARKVLWERPLGTTRDHAPLGISVPGVFSLGGAAVTKGGVVFIAAAIDNYLRAFDLRTGEELWKGRLPAGGQASTMAYVSERTGKQYVVIAAGGHQVMGTTIGDHVVAFALPD